MFTEFQFHKGAIRTAEGYTSDVSFLDFNSIKVRLELDADKKEILKNEYFNSIKVRLEQLVTEVGEGSDKISIP